MKRSSRSTAVQGIGILGAGRLGSSLSLALTRSGHAVTVVASRRPSSARALAARLPSAQACSAKALVEHCQLVFLNVPDDALGKLVAELAWRRGQQVVHCSGALGLDALAQVARAGGLRGCLHPLQSFPARFAATDRFAGIVCGIEGDSVLRKRLTRICRDLGASSVSLSGVDRARYHAAAVFASNYLVALYAAATECWTLAGLPKARAQRALSPLTAATADNLCRMPLAAALTGPLARADTETIARHLSALKKAPQLGGLYRELGLQLLALPLSLTPKERARLTALLKRVV